MTAQLSPTKVIRAKGGGSPRSEPNSAQTLCDSPNQHHFRKQYEKSHHYGENLKSQAPFEKVNYFLEFGFFAKVMERTMNQEEYLMLLLDLCNRIGESKLSGILNTFTTSTFLLPFPTAAIPSYFSEIAKRLYLKLDMSSCFNGDRYRALITNFFIPELNNHDVQELWFQQDGSTCHTARATIDLLKDTFGDRLISHFGPVNWPPRSCDLTPLDYFLWGYVKSLVYADKPHTLDHLEDNIRRVIADIRPQMLEKVIENWTSRLDYIRASRGSHMP
ncbi:uncharacterized protein TNCV_1478871 [Trichonephila clavipes]|nr:uncharacterized protein TNCV_1478871 [Trichonephila clavipes]